MADSEAGILKQERMKKVSVLSNNDAAGEVPYSPGCANAASSCLCGKCQHRVQIV